MTIHYYPTVPSTLAIPGGTLKNGESIIVQGEPLPHCNRFCLNLVDQSGHQCVFHFDFRFDQNTTVRNCNYNSGWGHEERSPLPIHKSQFFYLEIRNANDRYLVAVNGQHHSEFVHRAPHHAAHGFQIQGDVRVHTVEFKNLPSHHESYGPSNFYTHSLHAIGPSLPFVSHINGTLKIGGEIQVHGRVPPHANRFSVNLQQGNQITDHSTIALHVNPRFEGGHNVIVLNSRHGGWAHEERVDGHHNPFQHNGTFLLTIRRTHDFFDIYANGVHIKQFNHRMSADVIDAVYIEGDVTIDRVLAI